MPGFFPFFSFRILHRFYRSWEARDLSIVPLSSTRKLMHNAGLLMRENPDGATVFYDEDRMETLNAYTRDSVSPPVFYFKLATLNPLFGNFTDLPAVCPGRGPVLRSEMIPGPDERFRLTAEPTLGPKDVSDLTEFKPLLDRADWLMPPVCLVAVCVREDVPLPGHRIYEIAFRRKKTIWQYHMLGRWAEGDLRVVDLTGQVGFSNRGTTLLPGARKACVVESEVPVPLGPEGETRFQLRMKNGAGEKILLPRLAAAPLDPIGLRQSSDKTPQFLSKIFINP